MFELETELIVPRPRAEVFGFFADARNLERITPAFLRFRIVTPGPIEMRPGTIIDYRLRIRGIPVSWRTEITAWEPSHRFVDTQLKGPYKTWIHEHRFEDHAGGTRVLDRVKYDVLGGRLVNKLFVRPDVETIFAYRTERIREHFA